MRSRVWLQAEIHMKKKNNKKAAWWCWRFLFFQTLNLHLLILVLFSDRGHNPKLKHLSVFCSSAQTLSKGFARANIWGITWVCLESPDWFALWKINSLRLWLCVSVAHGVHVKYRGEVGLIRSTASTTSIIRCFFSALYGHCFLFSI